MKGIARIAPVTSRGGFLIPRPMGVETHSQFSLSSAVYLCALSGEI